MNDLTSPSLGDDAYWKRVGDDIADAFDSDIGREAPPAVFPLFVIKWRGDTIMCTAMDTSHALRRAARFAGGPLRICTVERIACIGSIMSTRYV